MEFRRHALPRLLAGLQIGMLGGLLILAWFVAISGIYFGSPWALINLFAMLAGQGQWTVSLSLSTGIGAAIHLLSCSFLGILIAWVLPRPDPGDRTSIAGMAFGVIVSLLVYEFLWRRMLPALAGTIAPLPIFIAHGLFGASLAQFPRFFLPLVTDPPEVDPES